ncbi:MAG: ArnT family glycosyltransferase [Solirubrobacteraceae bacterium]
MRSIDEQVGLAKRQPRSYGSVTAGVVAGWVIRAVPWGICAITAIAAVLRLSELGGVKGNPFYDAAVHSMGLSWHNFLFGAFDPGAMLAVDKPPVDLWLQVAATKLLGWNSFALKLPEALGGTLAVPLLYDAVRRAVGRGAGLAAAASLAVMPVSVLTSRSDTMDSLMMLFIVAALWLTVRATAVGGRRWLVLAGVAVGLAFNVKLLEGLVVVPALVLLYAIGAPIPRRRRAVDIALAGVALVIVSLSWAVVVTLAPGRHPFPIGSANGSVFDAMFAFNGLGRLAGSLAAGTYSAAPGVFRLLSGVGEIGQLFGSMLVAAFVLGAAAAMVQLCRRSADDDPRRRRLAVAFLLAVIVWLGCGVAVLSYVSVLHARYLEAVTPAVAAAIGCGLASLVSAAVSTDARASVSVPMLAAALACVCWYTSSLASASTGRAIAFAAAAVLAAAFAVFVRRAARPAMWIAGALALACCLSFPIRESEAIVRSARSDSIGLPVHPLSVEAAISRYVRPRTEGIRYELAVDDPLQLAPLIIHDARPILPLTSFLARPLVSLAQLRQAARSGAVRYALVGSYPCTGVRHRAACVPAAMWIRRYGINVSTQAGIPATLRLRLYRVPR